MSDVDEMTEFLISDVVETTEFLISAVVPTTVFLISDVVDVIVLEMPETPLDKVFFISFVSFPIVLLKSKA